MPGDDDFRFEMLNPAAGCRGYDEVHLNPDQLDPDINPSAPLDGVVCEVDFHNQYIMLSPDIERKGLTARTTVNIGTFIGQGSVRAAVLDHQFQGYAGIIADSLTGGERADAHERHAPPKGRADAAHQAVLVHGRSS